MNILPRASLAALLLAACTARGNNDGPPPDAAAPDVTAPDVPAPDVPAPDVPAPDVPAPDVPAPDVPAPDVPAPDVTAPDAPAPDVAPVRCMRDLDCSGVTFCSPDGLCVPLVCTPGRLMCLSPARAQVCDGRGATFAEMDCPGGCVLNNCMGATNPCASPRVLCGAACTDVQTAAAHCGRCGNACAAGQSCVAGACVTPCAAPRLTCAGVCTDVSTSATHCGRCGNACAAGQSCVAGACAAAPAGTFRVASLSTTGCVTVEHAAATGDDRGGIAVTGSAVFYNADNALGRWTPDLTGFTALPGPRDGMISDLATGTLYAFLSAAAEPFGGSTAMSITPFTITQLGVLDPATAALTPTRVPLSAPITITHDAGFFAGPGFLLVFSGLGSAMAPQRWFRIELPSGAVTVTPAVGNFTHHVCENGAFWGIAERAGADYSAVFVRNNTSVGRVRVVDGVQTIVGTYTDLADICSITAAPARGRWYFHNEGASEIAPMGVETTGWCPGTFTTAP